MSRVATADVASIAAAARLLAEGELVVFPTETVYGLGGAATNAGAIAKIFAAKGRPLTHPLIVHVADARGAAALSSGWGAEAARLAAAFWPGPLTLVVPRHPSLPAAVAGGKETVALRSPAHPVAQALLAAFGGPIAAPSANRYQSLSPTRVAHVALEAGVALLLDGGPCPLGLESTVVDVTKGPPRLLRPGALGLAALRQVAPDLVVAPAPSGEAERRSPGQDAVHYAPRARLRLYSRAEAIAAARTSGTALLLRGGAVTPAPTTRLLPADPEGYARELFSALHALDVSGVAEIAVEAPPDEEAWLAVNDRLRRAASR